MNVFGGPNYILEEEEFYRAMFCPEMEAELLKLRVELQTRHWSAERIVRVFPLHEQMRHAGDKPMFEVSLALYPEEIGMLVGDAKSQEEAAKAIGNMVLARFPSPGRW